MPPSNNSAPLPPVSVLYGHDIRDRPSEEPSWLWRPYLAFGAVSVLDGDPDMGKSLITIDIAARLSTGRPMPDGSPAAENPHTGNRARYTVFINADDHVRQTILPRFRAADGNPDATIFLGGIGENDIRTRPIRFPHDLSYLWSVLSPQSGIGGVFVVIDPLSAVYPAAVSGSDAAVRKALDPLVRLAACTRSCILLVRHLNKSGGRRSIYRGGGGIGVVGVSRTGLLVGRHPDDPERRVMSLMKCNLVEPAPSLSYRIETSSARVDQIVLQPGASHPKTGEKLTERMVVDQAIPPGPVIAWDGLTPITADDLVSAKPDFGGQSARAAQWLKELLAKGPVPATVVEAKAQAEAFSYTTVRAVKVKLNIESHRVVVDGVSRWVWSLPQAASNLGTAKLNDLPFELQNLPSLPSL